MRTAFLSVLLLTGCYPDEPAPATAPSPAAPAGIVGRQQVLPGVPAAGNASACGRDTSYLDALQTGGTKVWGPYPDRTHQDYWRFANPPAAVINRAIAEGFNVQYQHGNYIITRTCR